MLATTRGDMRAEIALVRGKHAAVTAPSDFERESERADRTGVIRSCCQATAEPRRPKRRPTRPVGGRGGSLRTPCPNDSSIDNDGPPARAGSQRSWLDKSDRKASRG